MSNKELYYATIGNLFVIGFELNSERHGEKERRYRRILKHRADVLLVGVMGVVGNAEGPAFSQLRCRHSQKRLSQRC